MQLIETKKGEIKKKEWKKRAERLTEHRAYTALELRTAW